MFYKYIYGSPNNIKTLSNHPVSDEGNRAAAAPAVEPIPDEEALREHLARLGIAVSERELHAIRKGLIRLAPATAGKRV